MKRNWKPLIPVCMAGSLLATQLTGCSQTGGIKTADDASAITKETTESSAALQNGAAETDMDRNEAGDVSQTVLLGEGGVKEITWLAEDLDPQWDAKTATSIVCDDSGIAVEGEGASISGQVVTIDRAGTYLVSGTMADGQILVDTEIDETVHLILNGVELSNMTTAPIYSKGEGKIILTLADGTVNTVSDSTGVQYGAETEDEPDAPIFVQGNLTVNGTGSLRVYGNYQCGIRSKGNFKVVSGTLDINAASDGLKGRDSVLVRDGTVTIRAGKDGIKANNDKEQDQGYIWIEGGQITIAADDDGIQAETNVIVNGGEIHITESNEGIAGRTVDILGGVTKIAASDDGLNSAAAVETEQEKAMDQDGVYTRIAGGEVHINAMADGIDSNGDLYIEGGAVYLNGPSRNGDGILDYNGKGILTGGTLFGVGGSGMMQTFDETESTQHVLVVYYTEPQNAGTIITLADENGNELGSFVAEKEHSAAIISAQEIEDGKTYHVTIGDETVNIQVEGILTIHGTASGRGMGAGGRPSAGGGRGADGQVLPESGVRSGRRMRRNGQSSSSSEFEPQAIADPYGPGVFTT